jgi:hypothetical protein
MADTSESPDPQSDATAEVASEARSARGRAAKNRTRSPVLSPAITTRDRLTKDLGTSLRVHEAEVTQALEEVLSPFVDDGQQLELTPLLRAVGRLVEARQHQLRRTHLDHAQEVRTDKKLQQETRRRLRELRRVMVDLRQTVRSLYGKAAVRAYLGFDQPTGREPLLLLAQARDVLRHVQDPDRPRPQPKFGNQTVDWDWWVEKLGPPTQALQQAVYDQDHEARETESFHRARELELEAYDRQVHAAARWIAATFELADRKRYGGHLRPRTRRRQGRSKTNSEEEAALARSGGRSGEETQVSSNPPSGSVEGAAPSP